MPSRRKSRAQTLRAREEQRRKDYEAVRAQITMSSRWSYPNRPHRMPEFYMFRLRAALAVARGGEARAILRVKQPRRSRAGVVLLTRIRHYSSAARQVPHYANVSHTHVKIARDAWREHRLACIAVARKLRDDHPGD